LPLKVLHIITGLNIGGAEMNLLKLLSALDSNAFSQEVISLSGPGVLLPRIEALGVPVHPFQTTAKFPNPAALLRLSRLIRHSSPHIVQTWMYHADLLGGLAARLAGKKVVWGIRTTDVTRIKRSTRSVVRLNRWLSHTVPEKIVCVAQASRSAHEKMGFDGSKMVVIPNGFNLAQFRPDPRQYERFRAEHSIPASTPLVGMVARYHPVKDFHSFILAAAQIRVHQPTVRFVLVGEGVDSSNTELRSWIERQRLPDNVLLLGPRTDVPDLLPAFDLLVSASLREGFPQVVGEAMSCGVPCVVTGVGDSALLVGDTGRVVPPAQPEGLAAACLDILTLPPAERHRLSLAARGRIEAQYNIHEIAQQYASLYQSLTGQLDGSPTRSTGAIEETR
jgi:glycosyltransferase involved in cell wall biosynthesis